MKLMSLFAVALFSAASVFAQSNSSVEFKETKHSFGKIKQNIPATYTFVFKNTSDKPVVIESAVAGCGCTTPEFPKGAIPSGGSEKIKVTFNAATVGIFTKDVTVKVANVADPIMLKIDGEVLPAEAAADIKDKNAVDNKTGKKDIKSKNGNKPKA